MMTKTDYTVKKVRVAIYVRVSTQEQAKEGYSIKEQIDRLKMYAEVHDYVVVKIYTDAGHSGGNMNRPALQNMIEDIEAGRIDKVCVYKLDRLSRSQKDTMTLLEDIFLSNNCDFESMTEKFDTATSFGRAMIGILSIFAQLERENIKERMTMGMAARIKEGKWRGGKVVPFGYDYEAALEKLVVNEYEAMIVKEIFKSFTEGKSISYIADHMLTSGHTFRNGKADARNIRYILKSKLYCGYQRYKDQWEKGLHDAIVDEETYDKAQKRIEETKERFLASGHKIGVEATSTNLGGLLICARCGAKYAKYRTGTKEYGFHFNYGCYSRNKKCKHMIKDPNCKNKNWRIEELDSIVFDQIRKLAIDPEYIHRIKKDHLQTDTGQKIHAIESQIKQINGQLSRFMDLYGIGKYTIEELDAKTTPLQDQRTKLKRELTQLQKDSQKMPEEEVIRLVESFDEVLTIGDLQETRSVIQALISHIELDGDDLTIHWNFT